MTVALIASPRTHHKTSPSSENLKSILLSGILMLENHSTYLVEDIRKFQFYKLKLDLRLIKARQIAK